jgi:hypothetical protein
MATWIDSKNLGSLALEHYYLFARHPRFFPRSFA